MTESIYHSINRKPYLLEGVRVGMPDVCTQRNYTEMRYHNAGKVKEDLFGIFEVIDSSLLYLQPLRFHFI